MKYIPIIGAALAFGLIGFAAHSQGATAPLAPAAACTAKGDLNKFFNGLGTVAYVYPLSTEDTSKVINVFAEHAGPPPYPITRAYVAVTEDGDAGFFFAGTDGCIKTSFGPFGVDDVLDILDAAGVKPPFGSTYMQIPGTPGSVPGSFVTGDSI